MRIILIVVDTLRADRLGCYGYKRGNISPHIDHLAKQGVLFEQMIAENNVTQSSFVTMMTGKNPHQHGVVNMKPIKISPRLFPISQILQKNGYQTAAVDCNYRITGRPNPWFKRGYHTYLDPSENRPTHLNLSAQEINQKAIPWLKKHRNEKNFFLFLHYWDPHYPYQPETQFAKWAQEHLTAAATKELPLKHYLREPLWSFIAKYNKDGKTASQIRQQYDGTVKQVDHYIGELISTIKDLGMFEDTCIIFTSDHGESLGEHSIYFDHHGLYDATIRVPLILTYPKVLPKGKRIQAISQHADLFPTIMELANIRPPRGIGPTDGHSLIPLISGKKKQNRGFAISCEANWQLKRAIRTPQWKLIHSLKKDVYGNPVWELYNLKEDPGETRNVVAKYPQVAKKLRGLMDRWVRGMLAKYKRKDPLLGGVKVRMNKLTVAEEEKVKKRLSELGY